ncbi:MAG TPA: hypothetical protein VJK54_06655, partial [Chthoniobacterales bacterium]|nr:hypothetical protein [Chthoniobacterales bacterium]
LDASSTGATKQFAAGVEFEAKSIKELIPLLDGLLVKDERLQENALSLRNLEQKKKLLRERIETLKTEITSSEKIGEPLLAQQQQTLLETLQQALDKASDTTTQLMAGAEHASEQAKAFFNEVDQLQHHDQQLKENIAKVQELQQKKKILQQRLSTLSEEMKATQDQREVLIAQSQQVLADKVTKMLPRIEATIELLRKGTIEVLPTAERANTLLVEIIELEQRDYGFQQNIPVLRECIEKGLFLHTHIVQLKEKIAIGHSSQDKGEQFIAQGQQKLLDAFQEAQPHIEDMVKQLLAGSKEASEQAKALLTQIKQLEQREKSFQKNIPTLLELEQKRVSLQTRMEALKNEIVLSTNREEILITQYQQALLEAIQRAMDHASECITQLIDGINDTPEKIEAQKKVQIEQLAKITTAEKTLQEIEKKETERAAELASVAWNNAVEIARQADEANVLASRTKTERSYNEVHRLAQDAKNAWVKTLEAQKIIFSKTSEQDKRLLDIKIKMSTSRIEQYDQLAIEALKNAKEAVSIAQEMATAAWDKAIELHDRAKQIKDEAETIKTEHAYIQMANADKAAGDAWGVALEAKKALLSKGGESDRPDLFAEIETAERRKEAYAKRVLVGLEKAQAAGRVAAENSKLQLETREKIIKLTSQIEEAKQASKEKSYRKNVFDYIATKLEQARDNWNKVSELLGQGKREKSALWRKAAEASEASAEVLSRAVQDDISRQKDDRCESLEEKIWNAYHLSDASTWSLKSEEALEKVNQVPNKGRDFWRNLAQQYQVAADYKKNAVKFSDYIGPWDSNYAGMCAHSSADYQVKAAEAQEAGNLILAGGYREAAETLRKAVEQYQQAIRACTSKREREGMCWSSVGNSLELQADYQVKSAEYQIKASEAQKTGKITLVAGYREAAETLQKAREALNQYAEQNQQAALDEAAGKKPDVIYSWKYKGRSLEAMASYQVKA